MPVRRKACPVTLLDGDQDEFLVGHDPFRLDTGIICGCLTMLTFNTSSARVVMTFVSTSRWCAVCHPTPERGTPDVRTSARCGRLKTRGLIMLGRLMYHYHQIEGGEEPWKPVQARVPQRIWGGQRSYVRDRTGHGQTGFQETPRDDRLALSYRRPSLFSTLTPRTLEESLACVVCCRPACMPQLSWAIDYATGPRLSASRSPWRFLGLKVDRRGCISAADLQSHGFEAMEDCMDFRVYSNRNNA